MRQTLNGFYERGGAGKPVILQLALSYARDEAEARRGVGAMADQHLSK